MRAFLDRLSRQSESFLTQGDLTQQAAGLGVVLFQGMTRSGNMDWGRGEKRTLNPQLNTPECASGDYSGFTQRVSVTEGTSRSSVLTKKKERPMEESSLNDKMPFKQDYARIYPDAEPHPG